jgi:uncharacterized protein
MDPEQIIASLKDKLELIPEVQIALLFGSFAQNKSNQNSDIDLAIAFKEKMSLDERINLAQELSRELRREVDLVDLRTASGVLLQQILDHRKTLIRRDPVLVGQLISKRVAEESDFMPLLDMILKARRERMINGTKSN